MLGLQTGATIPGLSLLNRARLLLSEFTVPTVCDRLRAGPLLPWAFPSLPPLWWLLTAFGVCTSMCLHALPNNAFSTYQKQGIAVFVSKNASSEVNTVGIPTYAEAHRGQRTVPLALVCTQLFFLWS